MDCVWWFLFELLVTEEIAPLTIRFIGKNERTGWNVNGKQL